MKLSLYINELKNSKIDILRYWVQDTRVFEILKRHDIGLKVFLKEYAINILDCYLSTIENENEIINCEVLNDFLKLLKNRGISSSEFFLFFSAFKNSLMYILEEKKLLNYELIEEITKIHEKNFVSVLNSYTKRIKDIENELSKSENLIHKYIIISTTDENGIITDVTDAFCDICGYSRDELIGKSHNIIKHPDTKNEVYEDLWQTITGGQTWHGVIKNRKKDGSYYWVDIRILPSFDSENNIITYHAICQDITSQKDLESQQEILIEQSKSAAMGEMISMIAHQWRQPLQAVSILIQKLPISKATEGEITDELLDQVVNDITKQLKYMSKTIDDFRDFFIPDKKKETIKLEVIISKTLEFLNFMFKTDSINICIDEQDDIELDVHTNELIQVLINILKNARDILVEKREDQRDIYIRYYKENDNVIIEIEDNAGGIDNSIIKKVFDPYFSTKNEKNGTGLGLYMCKTIIEKHCLGSLSVENTEKGALFKIELPQK